MSQKQTGYVREKFFQSMHAFVVSCAPSRERLAKGYMVGIYHARGEMTGDVKQKIDKLHGMLSSKSGSGEGSISASAASLTDSQVVEAFELFMSAYDDVSLTG